MMMFQMLPSVAEWDILRLSAYDGRAMNNSLGPQRLCGRDLSRTPCGNPAGCQRHDRYQ